MKVAVPKKLSKAMRKYHKARCGSKNRFSRLITVLELKVLYANAATSIEGVEEIEKFGINTFWVEEKFLAKKQQICAEIVKSTSSYEELAQIHRFALKNDMFECAKNAADRIQEILLVDAKKVTTKQQKDRLLAIASRGSEAEKVIMSIVVGD